MLVKITTTKGVILAAPDPDTVRFNTGGIEFFDYNHRGTRVEKKDLLGIEVSDIQNFESNYKMNGVDIKDWPNQADNIISIKVKNKIIRYLIVWLFGLYPKQIK